MVISSKRRVSGVTLVELMVALAVLAILATVGYPLYTQQLLKGQRTDARSGLQMIAMAQEREFGAWGQYSELVGSINTDGQVDISFDDNLPVADANSSFNGDMNDIAREYGGFYNFRVAATATTFTVTATPVRGQVDDTDCASLTIDQTGARTAVDSGGNDQTDLCW